MAKGLFPAENFCAEDLEHLRRQKFALLEKIKLFEPHCGEFFIFHSVFSKILTP